MRSSLFVFATALCSTACVDATPAPRPALVAAAGSASAAAGASSPPPDAVDAGSELPIDAGQADADADDAAPTARAFHPDDVGPMSPRTTPDGIWAPLQDHAHPGLPTIAFTTKLHPDKVRGAAEVFVLAVDRRRIRLFAVAGVDEPKATAASDEAKAYSRLGRIAPEHLPALLAAFNGGFKAQHGGLGMKVDGVVLVPPKDEACTVATYENGSVRIGAWSELAPTEPQMLFFRQTPRCLYAHGTRHPDIVNEKSTRWGAAFNGDTVIRRSAIGLDGTGDTLFVAVSSATTPLTLAEAMHHAGAVDVAQLDVNWSFPKLLVYRKNARGELDAASLFPGFVFTKDEYARRRSGRDFLYLVRTDLGDSASPKP